MSIKRGVMEETARREYDVWVEKISFLNDLMESTRQPFATGTPEGVLTIFNEAFCELTGYSREELMELNWAKDLTAPESSRRVSAMMELLDRTHMPQRFEKEYVRKDRSIVPVELFVQIAVDSRGKILFYYSFITDITERKRAEEELKEAKEQAELYLDLMSHDINNFNRVALGYLELADNLIKSGGKLDENNIGLIEKPIMSPNCSSKLIDNVRVLQKEKNARVKAGTSGRM